MPCKSISFPHFGLRLRRLRRAAGLKQLALADALGVDQATVSRWESGAQLPDPALQQRAWDVLGTARRDDGTLRRLVEQSAARVHLVDEANHICLAYSKARAREWQVSANTVLGETLWPFASDEIRAAEAALGNGDWWSAQMPAPRIFRTSERRDRIHITAGPMMWERLYLADGTPVRLVTGL